MGTIAHEAIDNLTGEETVIIHKERNILHIQVDAHCNGIFHLTGVTMVFGVSCLVDIVDVALVCGNLFRSRYFI